MYFSIRTIRYSVAAAACLAFAATVSGNPPLWWSEGDPPVIDPAAEENNQGPANIGQAKWMAKSALDALSAIDPSTATSIEAELVGPGLPIPSWDLPADQSARDKNHAPLLIGQLKAIAEPFYTNLHGLNSSWLFDQLDENETRDQSDENNYFPWTFSPDDDRNTSPATIGQLKAVFSLRFETLVPPLDPNGDPDDDDLTTAEELALGTSPTKADTDGDGIPDGWEAKWGLNPLDSNDALADTDGDHVNNLREFEIQSNPAGTYRAEVLPVGINQYFYSADDDGSVILSLTPIWDGQGPLEMVTAPDIVGNRSLIPAQIASWNDDTNISTHLVSNGTISVGDALVRLNVESDRNGYRIYETNNDRLVLQSPGAHFRTLPANASWQAINNLGEAAGVVERTIPAEGEDPAIVVADLSIADGSGVNLIQMPIEWFPAPELPTITAFSDDGHLLIKKAASQVGTLIHYDYYLFNKMNNEFTKVRQPFGGNGEIISLSNMNGLMLVGGQEPYRIDSDGVCIKLKNINIKLYSAASSIPLSDTSLYPGLLVPHHIASNGRITLHAVRNNGTTELLQLTPENDYDQDGLADDWEQSEVEFLVASDATKWGHLETTLNLDPNSTYWDDGYTAAESYTLGFNWILRDPSMEADTDNDSLVDSMDADPLDSVVDWRAAPEASYAVILLDQLGPDLSHANFDTTRASIGADGMVLWVDLVNEDDGTSGSAVRERSRIWKNGVWSGDLKKAPTLLGIHPINSEYTSDERTPDAKTSIVLQGLPFSEVAPGPDLNSNKPAVVCGDRAIGSVIYKGSSTVVVTYRDGYDEDGDEILKTKDVLFNDDSRNVNTQWMISASGIVSATPLPSPSSPAKGVKFYQNRQQTYHDEWQAVSYQPVASPGGALAILGGELTTADRKWMIWSLTDPPDQLDYQPGIRDPASEIAYRNNDDEPLVITAIEDGGLAVGHRTQGAEEDFRRYMVTIKDGVEQRLPSRSVGAPDLHESVNAICQIHSNRSTDPKRVVAAGSEIWVEKQDQWHLAKRRPTAAPVIAVSEAGVLLGKHSIWRNGKNVSLDKLVENQTIQQNGTSVPRFTNLKAYAMNSEGAIVATAEDKLIAGTENRALICLAPVTVDRMHPRMVDDNDNEIVGSEFAVSLPKSNPMVERDPTPKAVEHKILDASSQRIAWRDLKVNFGKIFAGQVVTWTMTPQFTPSEEFWPGPPRPNDYRELRLVSGGPRFRGSWAHAQEEAYRDAFSPSLAYGRNGWNWVSATGGSTPGTATTIVGVDGFSAIRVNVPPIGFNKARIKVQIAGTTTSIDLTDLEVPAVVVIDPGHGGRDVGAVANGLNEKELTFEYSFELKDEISRRSRTAGVTYKAIATQKREDLNDKSSAPLAHELRPRVAKKSGADVFLSIHFNSGGATAHGAECHIERTTEQGLIDLRNDRRRNPDSKENFPGDNINQESDAFLASRTLPLPTNRGVFRTGKVVTRDIHNGNDIVPGYAPVRACLYEVGFLTNASDSNLIGGNGRLAFRNSVVNRLATSIINDLHLQPSDQAD